MHTGPVHPIDKKRNRFLLQFHDTNNYVVAICPIYVLGVRQTGSGSQITCGRQGGGVDVFQVKDAPAEVCDRLDAAFEAMENSFVASFLRNDVGAMEDRLQTRIAAEITERIMQKVNEAMRSVVREEVATMAALDMPAEPEAKPKKKAG